jgi:hypothetical protein
MAAAAEEAGKTLRLRLAVAVAVAVTPQAHRRLLRLAVAADSQHRRGRVLTFKESPGRLVPATVITDILAVAAGAGLPMLPLQLLAAGRCLVAAVAGLAAEPLQFLLQTARLRAVALALVSAVAEGRAFLVHRLHPAMQAGRLTAPMAVRVAVVAVQPCRLLQTAQQAVRVVLEAAVAAAVVVAAIRALAVRAASAVLATVL